MFDNAQHYARFLGVSTSTAQRWNARPGNIPSSGLRLLEVMEALRQHAPALHAVLVEQARPAARQPRRKPAGPFVGWQAPAAPAEPPGGWSDLQELRQRWDDGELDDHLATLDDEAYQRYKREVWGTDRD